MSFGEQPIVRLSREKSHEDSREPWKSDYDPRCGLCLGIGEVQSVISPTGYTSCKACNGTGWSESRKSK